MRIAIASRIFSPEPSAASFRLEALADTLNDAGHEVTVYTVKPPAGLRSETGPGAEASAGVGATKGYKIKRAPVLRDKTGYVRGYLQYMSFDIPLFFRLLFSKRFDAIIVEPPPTTGFIVRILNAVKRTPYFYYAADIWSDAAKQTTAPKLVINLLAGLEKFALRGATTVLSVSAEVTKQVRALKVSKPVETIGNGVNTNHFFYVSEATSVESGAEAGVGAEAGANAGAAADTGAESRAEKSLMFVYTGTASELHGAEIFVQALPQVIEKAPETKLRFIGGGTEKDRIDALAQKLGVRNAVTFEEPLAPQELSRVLSETTAALASLRPGRGYDFAFPTKLYSAASCGSRMIFTGPGPAVDFVQQEVAGEAIGTAVPYETEAVAEAMIAATRKNVTEKRKKEVSDWARANISLAAVSRKAVKLIETKISPSQKHRDQKHRGQTSAGQDYWGQDAH